MKSVLLSSHINEPELHVLQLAAYLGRQGNNIGKRELVCSWSLHDGACREIGTKKLKFLSVLLLESLSLQCGFLISSLAKCPSLYFLLPENTKPPCSIICRVSLAWHWEIPNTLICKECCQPWLWLNPHKYKGTLATFICVLKERRMWLPRSRCPWHKGFPVIQDIPKMGSGAGPPACWLRSAAGTFLQAPAFPNTAEQPWGYTKPFRSHLSDPRAPNAAMGPSSTLEQAPCSLENHATHAHHHTTAPLGYWMQ